MNKEIVLVVFLIQNLELPKGYVANGYVKEAVRQVGFLKSLYRNLVFMVELLGNAPGNAVQLYAVHFGISHILRQQTHEVTNAAAGFQNVAGLEAQIGKPLMVLLKENTHPNEDGFSPMVIDGHTLTEKKAAGTALLDACNTMTGTNPIPLGSYRGFQIFT